MSETRICYGNPLEDAERDARHMALIRDTLDRERFAKLPKEEQERLRAERRE
jgi:hypothetical protein